PGGGVVGLHRFFFTPLRRPRHYCQEGRRFSRSRCFPSRRLPISGCAYCRTAVDSCARATRHAAQPRWRPHDRGTSLGGGFGALCFSSHCAGSVEEIDRGRVRWTNGEIAISRRSTVFTVRPRSQAYVGAACVDFGWRLSHFSATHALVS